MSKKIKLNKFGLRLATVSAVAILATSLGGTSAYADECLLSDDALTVFTAGFITDVNDSSGVNSVACGLSLIHI